MLRLLVFFVDIRDDVLSHAGLVHFPQELHMYVVESRCLVSMTVKRTLLSRRVPGGLGCGVVDPTVGVLMGQRESSDVHTGSRIPAWCCRGHRCGTRSTSGATKRSSSTWSRRAGCTTVELSESPRACGVCQPCPPPRRPWRPTTLSGSQRWECIPFAFAPCSIFRRWGGLLFPRVTSLRDYGSGEQRQHAMSTSRVVSSFGP